MSATNIDVVHRAYDAWNAGDLDPIPQIFHDEFEFHEPAEVPGAGDSYGRAEFERYLTSLQRNWDEFRSDPEQLEEFGDVVVAVVTERGRGKASGVRVEQRLAHVWWLRDGKVLRLDAYFDRAAALEAAGVAG